MPPQLGTTLGPYQVTARIGEGGMGELYRAGDTRFKRPRRDQLHDRCSGADNSGMTLAVIIGVALAAIGAIFLFGRRTRSEAEPMNRAELLDRMNKVL